MGKKHGNVPGLPAGEQPLVERLAAGPVTGRVWRGAVTGRVLGFGAGRGGAARRGEPAVLRIVSVAMSVPPRIMLLA